MAMRKATMQRQVAEVVAAAVPGDEPLCTMFVVRGPNPMLFALFGGIGALIGASMSDYYFFTVTRQGVLFHRASSLSSRPKEVAYALTHAQAGALLSGLETKTTWSRMFFHFPGKDKPAKLNFPRPWRTEGEWIFRYLTDAYAASGGVPQGGGHPGQVPNQYAPQAANPYPGQAPQQYAGQAPQQYPGQAPGPYAPQPPDQPPGHYTPQPPHQPPGPYPAQG
ncbi:hypothetical protein ACFRCG_24170 [Embleya sp. NPDC056575]|uniref:hypothetical protein n=1 Tax=unclassified Embleya TaxID=2699296 RepID=UPI0036C4ED95